MLHAVGDAATLGGRQVQHDLLIADDAASVGGVKEVGIDDLDIREDVLEKIHPGRFAHRNPDSGPQTDQRLHHVAAGKTGPARDQH